jgi:tetratricopeptide (TPR) repeat protein
VSDRELFLSRSLADLDAEHDAGDLSDEDYAQLKSRYQAAQARETEQCERDSAPAGGAESRPHWRGIATVALIVAVAVGAGALVARSAGDRVANDSVTGSIEQGSNDKLARAQALVQQGKVLDAVKAYDAILRTDPKNVAALSQRGWVIRGAGLIDDGLTYIDRAIAADPTYPDAHFFKAMILWKDKGDAAAAVPEFRLFLANAAAPADAAQVEPLLRQAEAEAGGQPAPATTTTTVPAR